MRKKLLLSVSVLSYAFTNPTFAIPDEEAEATNLRPLFDFDGEELENNKRKMEIDFVVALTSLNPQAIQTVLEKGFDVNTPMGTRTPLLLLLESAIYVGPNYQETEDNILKIANLFLQNKANVNATGPNRITSLMKAAQFGRSNVFKLLVDHGAELYAKDKWGQTAEDYAKVLAISSEEKDIHGLLIDASWISEYYAK